MTLKGVYLLNVKPYDFTDAQSKRQIIGSSVHILSEGEIMKFNVKAEVGTILQRLLTSSKGAPVEGEVECGVTISAGKPMLSLLLFKAS